MRRILAKPERLSDNKRYKCTSVTPSERFAETRNIKELMDIL
jgi:hypothetical protein